MKSWRSPDVDVKFHVFSAINDVVNEDLYVDLLDGGQRHGEYHVIKHGLPGSERFTHVIFSSDTNDIIGDIVEYHGKTYYEWLDEAKNKLFKGSI